MRFFHTISKTFPPKMSQNNIIHILQRHSSWRASWNLRNGAFFNSFQKQYLIFWSQQKKCWNQQKGWKIWDCTVQDASSCFSFQNKVVKGQKRAWCEDVESSAFFASFQGNSPFSFAQFAFQNGSTQNRVGKPQNLKSSVAATKRS